MKAAVLQVMEEFKVKKRTVETAMADYRKALRNALEDRDAKKRAIDLLEPQEKMALRK